MNQIHRRHLALAGFYATVIVSPQLLGGVPAWAIAIISYLTAMTVCSVWWYTRDLGHKRPLPWTIVLLSATVLWTAFQALPLPCGPVRFALANIEETLTATRKLLGLSPPVWCTVSLSPGGTYLEILKHVSMFGLFCSAWTLGEANEHRHIWRAVALSCLGMAVVAGAHVALDATKVFGLYAPVLARPRVLAPLMNENHLAGLMSLGAPLVLGFGISQRSAGARTFWLLGYLLMALILLLTLSRGGMVAFAGGSGLAVYLWLRHGRLSSRSKITLAAFSIAFAGCIVLVAFLSGDRILQEWQPSNVDKIARALNASVIALDHPWLGVGRGAFSQAYSRYTGSETRIDYPENFLVQLASEWGLPFALVLCLGLLVALVIAFRYSRSLLRIGALVAVAAVVSHNLLDFGLETLGVSIPFVALLGGVLTPRPGRSPATSRVHLGLALKITTLMAIAGAVSASSWATDWDRRNLERALYYLRGERSGITFTKVLQKAMLLYPSEPSFALLASHQALDNHRSDTPKWINYTMLLAPGWADPHLLAARWLYSEGHPDQALLEVREAAVRSLPAAYPLACQIARVSQNPQWIWRAAPLSMPKRLMFLDSMASCLNPQAQDKIDTVILRKFPHHVPALVRKGVYLLRAPHPQPTAALALLQTAIREAPSDVPAYEAIATCWIALGNPSKAIAFTEKAERMAEDPRVLLRIRAEAQAQLHDYPAMRDTLNRLRSLHPDDAEYLADAWFFAGELERRENNFGHAIKAYQHSYRLSPKDSVLAAIAYTAEQQGNLEKALRIYGQLASKNPRYRRDQDRLQLRLDRQ
ncbi:MAG: O-antigen ligase family protein [Myxococcales bacterium]|nr:O-antigen ligase family protein [Myxococcales bacterium]